MSETAHPAVGACGIFKIKRRESVRQPRLRIQFETMQESVTDQMRRFPGHISHAEVYARFSKVCGQELGMAVREMHQRHIVAELMQIVEAVDRTRCLGVRVKWKARCCCNGECVQEFASRH